MTLSTTALAVLVGTATLVTTVVPVVLVIFWIRDWIRGDLW